MRFVPRQSCHAHSPLVEEPLAHAVHMAVVDEVRHSVERADVAAPLRVSGCQKRTPSHQNKRATATGTKSERTLHATTCDEQTRRLTGKTIRGKRQPNTKIRPRLASPDRTGIQRKGGNFRAPPFLHYGVRVCVQESNADTGSIGNYLLHATLLVGGDRNLVKVVLSGTDNPNAKINRLNEVLRSTKARQRLLESVDI